jgi:hypothetical protein
MNEGTPLEVPEPSTEGVEAGEAVAEEIKP